MSNIFPETLSQINDSTITPIGAASIRTQTNLQQENVELKVRVANLESRITTILSDASLSDAKIQDLIEGFRTIDELTTQVSRLKSQLEEANNLNRSQKQSILDQQAQLDDYRKQVADLSSKLTIEQSKNSSTDENTQAMQTMKLENSKLKREISSLDSNNAELSIENMNLKSQLKDYDNDRTRYETELNQFRNTNSDLKNRVNVLQNTNNSLLAEIEDLKRKMSQMDSSQSIQQLQLANKYYESAFKAVLSRTKNFDSQCKSFLNTVTTKISSVSQDFEIVQKQKLNQLRKRIEATEKSSIDIVTGLTSLIANLSQLEKFNIPDSQYLLSHPEALTEFESAVQTAYTINENKMKQEITQLQRQLKKSLNRPSVLSPEVANLVQQMQQRVQQMTDRVESEHHAFISAIESVMC